MTTKVSQNLLDSITNFSIGAPFTVTGTAVTTLGGNLIVGDEVASGDEGGEIGFERPPNLGGSLGCALDLHATGFRFIADYGNGTQTATVKLPTSGNVDFIHNAGGQTIGSNCQIDTAGNIKLDRASSERNIAFTNAGTNQIYFYGNPAGSAYDVGLYDGKNTRGVWRYDESVTGGRFDVECTEATWGGSYLRRQYQPTAIASNNATNTDLVTDVPAWADEIVIAFEGVSLASPGIMGLQLGNATSWITTGYLGMAQIITSATPAAASAGTRIVVTTAGTAAAASYSGLIRLLRRQGTNVWIAAGQINRESANESYNSTCRINVTAELTRIRTSMGANWDAGVISMVISGAV